MYFYMPTKVYQGRNVVRQHGDELVSFGKKALVVTGAHSSKANGSLQDVQEVLEQYDIEYRIFDRIGENPTVAMIMEAAQIGREQGTDFVIGIGGGSPMDAAKAIALMIQNRDSSADVLYQPLSLRALSVVEVPTTCGTGSEVTPYAILTRDDLETKQSISHTVFPELALVDPAYLQAAPLSVLTNTAIDAVGHLIESYFNASATDYSRMPALQGMEVWGSCKQVLMGVEAEETEYSSLMLASSLAGMAITHTSTSLPHGLSYYLTYHKGIPHGRAVGYFLPGYLDLFMDTMEAEVMMVLRILGFGCLEQFAGFLRECIGVPELTEAEMTAMLDEIMQSDRKLAAVPLPVDRQMIEEIIRSAC